MKFAISNIAWETHDDHEILQLLKKYHVAGIEVAPTKIWPDWQGAGYERAHEYQKTMKEQGFALPVMQAILFGKPELQVFDRASHTAFLEHFRLLADLAAGFECKTLVFGAPKNRKRNCISFTDALTIAGELFYNIGEIIKNSGAVLGIEANPVEYGCDFLTNIQDVKNFTEEIASPYIQPHFDSAAVYMCGGNIQDELTKTPDFCHFHLSEPMLEPLAAGVVNHRESLNALKAINYNKWISIEMKQPERVEILEESLKLIHTEL